MKQGIILGCLIIILLSGCTTNEVSSNNKQINSDINEVKQTCKDVQVPYEEQEAYMKTEYYTNREPYTTQECSQENMIYEITNPTSHEECIQEESCGLFCDKCVRYKRYCSFVVTNKEREGTYFEFNLYKHDTDSNKNELVEEKKLYVQALNDNVMAWSFSYNYLEPMNCNYKLTQSPTMSVCRDVIKYKDVQKTRQITAYRPITKYKTEERCS